MVRVGRFVEVVGSVTKKRERSGEEAVVEEGCVWKE
jgi:hypothetical protein